MTKRSDEVDWSALIFAQKMSKDRSTIWNWYRSGEITRNDVVIHEGKYLYDAYEFIRITEIGNVYSRTEHRRKNEERREARKRQQSDADRAERENESGGAGLDSELPARPARQDTLLAHGLVLMPIRIKSRT